MKGLVSVAKPLASSPSPRKGAGSGFWPGMANASSVALLTGLPIEFAPTSSFEGLVVIGIIALSCLVCSLFDLLQGSAVR